MLRPLLEQLLDAIPTVAPAVVLTCGGAALQRVAQDRWPSSRVLRFDEATGSDADAVLLALPSALITHPLQRLLEAAIPTGRIMIWSGGGTHENALLRAWREVCGVAPGWLARCAEEVAAPPRWTGRRIRDVVRADSVAQLRRALVEERGLVVPPQAGETLTVRLAHHLRRHEAADGTLRIPVSALLLSLNQPT